MERTWHVSVSPSKVDKALFARLIELLPANSYKVGSLYVARPDGDPLIERLRELLEAAGVTPTSGRGPAVGGAYYHLRESRHYNREELEQYGLLLLDVHVNRSTYSGYRLPTGELAVDRKEATKLPDGLAGAAGNYLVTQRLKEVLDGSGLVGLTFKPAFTGWVGGTINNGLIDWAELGQERRWELTSRLRMPPISLTTELLDYDTHQPLSDRQRTAQKWFAGVLPIDGFCDRPELRYKRPDLERWMPKQWDAARTYEPFSRPDQDFHPLICSQGMYRYFRDNDIEAEWVPVHVEE